MLKHCLYILVFIFAFSAGAQDYVNVELLDNWQDNTLSSNSSNVRYNDCWGFVHNGQEYAIIGTTEGSHFFKITDLNKLEFIDSISGKFSSSSVIHRDIKVYGNYAYVVCDEGFSSLQIIDLNYLPDSVQLVVENDSTFARVHNLFIDEENALMYACLLTPTVAGTLQSQKSMEVFSLSDPLNPVLLYSGPTDIPEVHDVYVKNNIAFLNCGFDGMRVYDFSNPSTPIFIQNISSYQDQGYNHQGWLSPDGKTYVFGDETNGKELKKCSVDQNNFLTIESRFGTNKEIGSVPHNIMLSNEFAFVAYYNEGLRIYDLRYNTPLEVAHYDTYPDESAFQMYGAWGVYSDLPSGRILVSDRTYGLFLFDFREDIFLNQPECSIAVYPNPVQRGFNLLFRIELKTVKDFKVKIKSMSGQELGQHEFYNQTYAEISINLASGIYFALVTYTDYLGDEQRESVKFAVQ